MGAAGQGLAGIVNGTIENLVSGTQKILAVGSQGEADVLLSAGGVVAFWLAHLGGEHL
jgi:hypothetical protein